MGGKDGRVDIGIIGYGYISPLHAEALMMASEVNLVAVADPDPARLKLAQEQNPGVALYKSHRDLLAHPGLQAVDICVPHFLHPEVTEAAAEAGKHVQCEKPMALTLQGCDRMIDACGGADVKLSIIGHRRFYPAFQAIRKAVDAGLFGSIVSASAYKKWWRPPEFYAPGSWRSRKELTGGRCMLGKGIHSIDLLNWFVGPIESIFGFAERRFHDINMEDVASAVVRYTSGAVGGIEVSTCTRAPQLDRLEIHGTKGSVIVEGLDVTVWKFEGDSRDPSSFPRRNQLYAQPGAQSAAAYTTTMEKVPGMAEGFTEQARDFARAIADDRAPCCDGRQGRQAVEAVLAFYRSAATRMPVALPFSP